MAVSRYSVGLVFGEVWSELLVVVEGCLWRADGRNILRYVIMVLEWGKCDGQARTER